MAKGKQQSIYVDEHLAALSTLPAIYFRRSDRLSARDRADLEAYAEVGQFQ